MKIYTLTLNPAFDVHCVCDTFTPYKESLARIVSKEAGGKGINISRALTTNGIDNTAIVVLGKENADEFMNALNHDNVSFKEILLNGRIRENITLHTKGKSETRISFSGFAVPDGTLADVASLISFDADTVVALSGRVQIAMPEVKKFLKNLKSHGAKIVIDSKSFSLSDLTEIKPWLIKPNQEEISAYLGKDIKSFDETLDFAKKIHSVGVENVMVSLGEEGAMLVNDDGVFIATPPRLEPVSTIGSGDSSIAGFISAYSKGENSESRIKTAVAFGTAACLTEGTKPPLPDFVSSIRQRITTKTL